jgi:hypothetical protein
LVSNGAQAQETTVTRSNPIRIAGMLAAAALLASCSATRTLQKRDAAQQARFQAYAGKPVREFTWLTDSHRGRWAIASNQLVAWSNFERPYLLTVAQPCPNLMLASPGIGITSSLDSVIAGQSYVIAQGFHCEIETIQPVDYRRMQRQERR